MAEEIRERTKWFLDETLEALRRDDKVYAWKCLESVQSLISPDTKDTEELGELACVLQLKSICSTNPKESADFLKESIRIEESLYGSRNPIEEMVSCVSLSSKYSDLGDYAKAIEYADKVDIDSISEAYGLSILFGLYGTYSTIRGKNDSKAKKAILKYKLFAERYDDMQKHVTACNELAYIALNLEKDKASAFSYCEQAWASATRDGFKNIKDLGPLLNTCKTAWECIPKRKGVLWSRRIMSTMAMIIESGYMTPEIAKMYLTSAYTLEIKNPKEKAHKDWVAKCTKAFGNDKNALAACLAEATHRAKIYL
ncbi:MAG: hypothetical protein LBT59_20710 [Clostridiales bacterium]|jgi:tetratricopeptide (TPR) repeat protein|nr:hypothetical protein [Clostridiales bacterium]